MQILLKSLHLVNFKGVRNQKFQFSPFLNIISGDNETGKTTIVDAFLWCLFGKDSTDRKDFEVKTLDSQGNVIHRLDHEVEVGLEVDFKEVSLKRVLQEKWTKKRGSEEAELTGNETTYFWNDVPLKQTDFQNKIKELIDEGLFKLLTNVSYFHGLHWEKRREIIFSLAGPISDSDILNGSATLLNKEYTAIISNILNAGKTLTEAKAETANKKKRIKDELLHIPARIDEAERSKPAPVDMKAVEAEKKAIQTQITDKQTELDQVITAETDYSERLNMANKAYNENLDSYYKVKSEVLNLKKKIEADVRATFSDPSAKIQALEKEQLDVKNQIDRLNDRILSGTDKIQVLEVKIVAKREEWTKVNSEEPPAFDDNSCNCPTCKQSLPEDEIRLKKDQFIANFNNNKTDKLLSIQQDGKELAAQKADLESLKNDLIHDRERLKSRLDALIVELGALKPLDQEVVQEKVNEALAENDTLLKLIADQTYFETQLLVKPTKDETGNELFIKRQGLQTDINILNKQLNELSAKTGNQDQIAAIDKRIEELKESETKLSQELSRLEQIDYAVLQYEKQRVAFIESRINDKFKYVSFRMFETQINGSEIPCCKTLINGVPYEDANTASKINAGLDVINALSQYYEIKAPVFIDNAESTNRFIDVDSQVVRLQVTKDKSLVFQSELQTA